MPIDMCRNIYIGMCVSMCTFATRSFAASTLPSAIFCALRIASFTRRSLILPIFTLALVSCAYMCVEHVCGHMTDVCTHECRHAPVAV